MRKQTTILLTLLLLSGLLWLIQPVHAPIPTVEKTQPIEKTTPKDTPNVFSKEPALPIPFYQAATSNLPEFSASPPPQSLQEKLFSSPFTNALQRREGSYSELSDLFQGDGTFSADLQSSWLTPYLFPNLSLPELRVRVVKDPETGEYRISGGALSLPQSGLEAGYELEMDNENYKATLQWKKEF